MDHTGVFTLIVSGYGQSISGTINQYTDVTAISSNVLTVSHPSRFSVGDTVLIIKMKGATFNRSNSPLFGDSVSLRNVGRYVFSLITDISGSDVTVRNFCDVFGTIEHIQMVSVPLFRKPTITSTLTCSPWNGDWGGILVFESLDTLTFNADIDVSNNGYKGGRFAGFGFNCAFSDFYSGAGLNGYKGEGIGDYLSGFDYGPGKQINGGGSACAGNAGGGGGANGGSGGRGGFQYSSCIGVGNYGRGGMPVIHDPDHLYMGGGGGGPQQDNGRLVYFGGNGGGIVFVIANVIKGNNHSIISNGQSIPEIGDEGTSGAGAGGTVCLVVRSHVDSLTIDALGGDGGDSRNALFTTACHGTGGGGGGGQVWLSSPTLPATVTVNVNGGAAGVIRNPASACFTPPTAPSRAIPDE